MSDPTDAEVQRFAEDLIDNLRIAEIVRERDEVDTGERLTIEELFNRHGLEPSQDPDGVAE